MMFTVIMCFVCWHFTAIIATVNNIAEKLLINCHQLSESTMVGVVFHSAVVPPREPVFYRMTKKNKPLLQARRRKVKRVQICEQNPAKQAKLANHHPCVHLACYSCNLSCVSKMLVMK